MKVSELFESDDDLNKFHKNLAAEIKARATARKAIDDAMLKNHKWLYDVNDVIMSAKTGMLYTIVARVTHPQTPKDEKGRPIKGAEKQYVPAYRYKAGEEEGTLLEPLIKPGMFTLMTKGKNVRTSPDED